MGTMDSLFSVAKWDGTRWTRLGTGIFDGPYTGFTRKAIVNTLVGAPEGLYLGGVFTHAGDKYSNNIALWENFAVSHIEEESSIPDGFMLYQNYPNPFNPTTFISWQLTTGSQVNLKIFDTLGREVQTLVNRKMPAGNYEIVFDAAGLPSGIYFYRLEIGGISQTRKMLLLR
jgi:hypothetical protein